MEMELPGVDLMQSQRVEQHPEPCTMVAQIILKLKLHCYSICSVNSLQKRFQSSPTLIRFILENLFTIVL